MHTNKNAKFFDFHTNLRRIGIIKKDVTMTYQLISWNIDSLNAALTGTSERAALSLAVIDSIIKCSPDILAIQETKLSDDPKKLNKILTLLGQKFPDYELVHRMSTPPARKGYAGTMMLYKKTLQKPLISYPEINAPEPMDCEGRIITLEFPDFFATTVYTPNSQGREKRLSARGQWDDAYRNYLKSLDEKKPVLACGDFNAAYTEIDLANPAANHESPGFFDEEREKFGDLLAAGFTDSFRYLHGNVEKMLDDVSIYTWFAQRVKTAKANNSGWRIDYWLVSNRAANGIITSRPINTGERKDHVPILLEIEL